MSTILTIVVLLTMPPDDASHRDALARFGAGLLKSKRDELLSAKKAFETASRQDPQAVEPLRSLLRLELDMGKYTASIRTARRILELDPDDYKTALTLGKVYLDGKQPKEAIEVILLATKSAKIKQDPSTAIDVYALLSKAYENNNNQESADKALVAVTDLYRTQAREIQRLNRWTPAEMARMEGLAYERLGLLRVSAKKPVEAGAAFFKAQALFQGPAQHPLGAARLNRNLARAFASTGESTKAIESFRKYLAADPPGLEPYHEYLKLMLDAGRADDAVSDLGRVVARKPLERGLAWLVLAAKVQAGKTDAGTAKDQFATYAVNSSDPTLYRIIAEFLPISEVVTWFDALSLKAHPEDQSTGKSDPASAAMLRSLSDAIREMPEVSKAFLDRVSVESRSGGIRSYGTFEFTAWLGERLGEPKLAESALQASANRADGNWERIRPLIAYYERQRKWKQVIDICEPMIKRQFRNIQAEYTAAYAYAELGRTQDALKLVEQLIRDDRLFAEGKLTVRMQQCRVLISAGESMRALRLAESLIDDAANPGEIRRIRVLIADSHFALKQVNEAEAQLRAILEEDPDDTLALNNLGYNLADRSLKLEEAEALCRHAVEQDRDDRRRSGDVVPESGTYLDSLGWCLFRRGKLNEAKTVLERAITLPDTSSDPTVWDHLGDVRFKLGDRSGANAAWKVAEQGYPETATGRQGGRLAELRKKLQLAP
ncbi:MAG: tetratricopeptide repeat protein [Gemmataceae bacterium]